MAISVFDLFKIGIGPSSSHTVGPMRAARSFALDLRQSNLLARTAAVKAELFGSLGATGRGHGSDRAVALGLLGETPEGVDVAAIPALMAAIRRSGTLKLLGEREVAFKDGEQLLFLRQSLPFHPNGMRFTALDEQNNAIRSRVSYSVGGGFVVDEQAAEGHSPIKKDETPLARPFTTAEALLEICEKHAMPISQVMLANERAWREEHEIRAGLLRIWGVMQECVQRGIASDGILPGGLKVQRRAHDMHRRLIANPEAGLRDPLTAMDWVNLYALAVNEENAAGGRVVTAPTNGAA